MKTLKLGIAAFVLLAFVIACGSTAPTYAPPQSAPRPSGEYCALETTILDELVAYEVAYGDDAQLFCSLLLAEHVEDTVTRQIYFIPDVPVRCSRYESDIELKIEVRSRDAWVGEEICAEFMK